MIIATYSCNVSGHLCTPLSYTLQGQPTVQSRGCTAPHGLQVEKENRHGSDQYRFHDRSGEDVLVRAKNQFITNNVHRRFDDVTDNYWPIPVPVLP